MGDMGDDFRAMREHRRKKKQQDGVKCPDCAVKLPKAQSKILMPGQLCWCGYRDTRIDKHLFNVLEDY